MRPDCRTCSCNEACPAGETRMEDRNEHEADLFGWLADRAAEREAERFERWSA